MSERGAQTAFAALDSSPEGDRRDGQRRAARLPAAGALDVPVRDVSRASTFADFLPPVAAQGYREAVSPRITAAQSKAGRKQRCPILSLILSPPRPLQAHRLLQFQGWRGQNDHVVQPRSCSR